MFLTHFRNTTRIPIAAGRMTREIRLLFRVEKQSDLITSIASESLDDFVKLIQILVGLVQLLDEANRDTGTTIELWMK